MIFFWIALAGALGTVSRYWLSLAVSSHFGDLFPWGTLIINITGSFAIGFFATLTGPDGPVLAQPETRKIFMIGFCGGYTTFSSFSLQTLQLAQSGQWLLAAGNIIASNVGCLVAVWLGHVCAVAIRK
jgi:fluoride exporter